MCVLVLVHLRFAVAPRCRQVDVGEVKEGPGGMKWGARRAGSGAVSLVVLGFLHREEVFGSDGKTQVASTCLILCECVNFL